MYFLSLKIDAYDNLGVHYYWLPKGSVWIDPGISLPQFDLQGHSIEDNTAMYYGEYIRLKGNFSFHRTAGLHNMETLHYNSVNYWCYLPVFRFHSACNEL